MRNNTQKVRVDDRISDFSELGSNLVFLKKLQVLAKLFFVSVYQNIILK